MNALMNKKVTSATCTCLNQPRKKHDRSFYFQQINVSLQTVQTPIQLANPGGKRINSSLERLPLATI
jgi:hypothetical protein